MNWELYWKLKETDLVLGMIAFVVIGIGVVVFKCIEGWIDTTHGEGTDDEEP